ncbi:MAG: DUF4956 domain-containing protein [Candidatus Cyclonatronum sp.]|uniref:DUF4956 domain-containing protein n=1 Tax=Cyclonatronum sp. TaxID=3024185 RepID=UPI0025B84595|nr:DUF4956 domain-containing protein [Cyclonatronum sp.]MCC5935447.1 DUF4956 domain-containing protein [Balneolales bacterium]MCH8487904.1 DUF4956 domain-containing protein [Cyclonatronum sp.]
MNDLIFFGDTAPLPTDIPTLLLTLLLAFMCGQLMAWVYMFTHSGLSYSRNFVSSLIILPITVATVMTVLDNNLVTAFSLLAVFAIVRFRNIVRDTLDAIYILSLIVVGMACGTQKFTTAAIATLAMALILLYLWFTSFGSRQRYDIILNLSWAGSVQSAADEVGRLLERHCLKQNLVSERAGSESENTDLSYRLLLRDPEKSGLLISELEADARIVRFSSMKAEDESEV